MSETSEDIGSAKLRNFAAFQVGGTNLIAPHHTNAYKVLRLCEVISLYLLHPITFELGNLTDFKALFPAVAMDLR